jgi:hypothetical protein
VQRSVGVGGLAAVAPCWRQCERAWRPATQPEQSRASMPAQHDQQQNDEDVLGARVAEQSFTWKLAYKTSSAAAALSVQGWGKDTVRAAFYSCNHHFAAIRYDVGGKPHSYYRRVRGPEKTGPDAWKKGACDQCDSFDPFELISDVWRSKQTSGASNQLGSEKDFEMYSNEQDFFGRKNGVCARAAPPPLYLVELR